MIKEWLIFAFTIWEPTWWQGILIFIGTVAICGGVTVGMIFGIKAIIKQIQWILYRINRDREIIEIHMMREQRKLEDKKLDLIDREEVQRIE